MSYHIYSEIEAYGRLITHDRIQANKRSVSTRSLLRRFAGSGAFCRMRGERGGRERTRGPAGDGGAGDGGGDAHDCGYHGVSGAAEVSPFGEYQSAGGRVHHQDRGEIGRS